MKIMNVVLKLVSAITLIVISTITQAQESKIPTSTDFNLGEQWEWARINNQTKKPEYNFFRKVVSKDGEKLFFERKKYNQLTRTFLGGSPKNPSRVWPLKVGNKWDYKNQFVSVVGVSVETSQSVEVLSFEEVTVAAGKFMAYKIAYIGSYINRKEDNSMEEGVYNETYWYAPSVKADVKYISEDGKDYLYRRELIQYSKNKS
ncbi:MAG: hypothetical protein ACI9IA_001650 [Enterobacterales bacterium]|jgi:hypothetical protein